MRHLTITFLACLTVLAGNVAAFAQTVGINTENSSLVLVVAEDSQLAVAHYGAPVRELGQYEGFNFSRRLGRQGSDPLAYPAAGGRYYLDPALVVRYADTDQNTVLVYDSHKVTEGEGGNAVTEVFLKDEKTALKVKLTYKSYYKEDVIVANAEIVNGGKKPVTLVKYASSALWFKEQSYSLTHFQGEWANEMQVETETLTHGIKSIQTRKLTKSTHTENASFILGLNTSEFDENHGEYVGGALAWSGNFKMDFQLDNYYRLNVNCGINPEMSSLTLTKGETFVTPPMIWTYSAKGAGQVSRNFHDWSRNWWSVNKGEFCPTLLNSWEGAYFKFDTKTLTDMIDDADSLGLEMFVLDDGWFGNEYPRDNDKQGLGDWDLNVSKIPEGIDYIASYAHNKGMKFGIWIEPEMVNPKSNLAQKHPDWIVGSLDRNNPLERNQWVLDLSNPKVQDFVFGVFDNTMKLSDKIDYIKWDCNRHVENFGSQYLDDQNEFFVKYTQGLYAVLERIRAKYPKVLIQCCSSGGGRVDYGAMKYFDEFWTSDNTDALSRVFIQYGTSMIYPPCFIGSHVSDIPNHQSKNLTPINFRLDMAFGGRMGFELQPKKMTPDEWKKSAAQIEKYKQYRDIISKGDLYRLYSPYDGSYYAFVMVSKDKKQALLFAYNIRYNGREVTPTFHVNGLDLSKTYTVKQISGKNANAFWGEGRQFTGEWLVNQGICPSKMFQMYDSAIWYFESK